VAELPHGRTGDVIITVVVEDVAGHILWHDEAVRIVTRQIRRELEKVGVLGEVAHERLPRRRDAGVKEDQLADGRQVGEQRKREAALRMADGDDIVVDPVERRSHDLGIGGVPGCRVRDRKIDGDRREPEVFQGGAEEIPTPGTMKPTMHQGKGRHPLSSYSVGHPMQGS
jgi:hypothetical protein